MKSCLVIPAAGAGSRLGSPVPKVLTPVNGRPMLDHLFDSYKDYVSRFVVVVHPSFKADVVKYCHKKPYDVEFVTQDHPTGMLDAILLAQSKVEACRPDYVWVTWCDQIAVHPTTIQNLQKILVGSCTPDLLFPTVRLKEPYTHLVRSENGDVVNILHRREGDVMPQEGESEMGVFCLSSRAFFDSLIKFSAETQVGMSSKERNFLPFIPWFQGKGTIQSIYAQHPLEALGINTPEELSAIEDYLNTTTKKVTNGHSGSLGKEA